MDVHTEIILQPFGTIGHLIDLLIVAGSGLVVHGDTSEVEFDAASMVEIIQGSLLILSGVLPPSSDEGDFDLSVFTN